MVRFRLRNRERAASLIFVKLFRGNHRYVFAYNAFSFSVIALCGESARSKGHGCHYLNVYLNWRVLSLDEGISNVSEHLVHRVYIFRTDRRNSPHENTSRGRLFCLAEYSERTQRAEYRNSLPRCSARFILKILIGSNNCRWVTVRRGNDAFSENTETLESVRV